MGESTVVKSKAESPMRWAILVLTCLIMIGNYYSYDNPAALKTQIKDYMGDDDNFEFNYNMLYTVLLCPQRFFALLWWLLC
jgi:hypothetical protein